ncbi:MAG: pyridoxamine 5'-phosphate oxidase family protein [Thioalkalivibrio sp.]|nr:pyridoxamine 5'-phosphate oxidase family protein [Thioalkalivibrio sp.]
MLDVAREIMLASRFCTLVTIPESGHPRARIMDPFPPEEGLAVWMGTHRKTRKIEDIRNDPRVTLSYFDSEAGRYVSLMGRARIVDDPAEKERHWKSEWEAFYPDRERDYLLIAVTPETIEVVSDVDGIVGDSETWLPPAVSVGKRPHD